MMKFAVSTMIAFAFAGAAFAHELESQCSPEEIRAQTIQEVKASIRAADTRLADLSFETSRYDLVLKQGEMDWLRYEIGLMTESDLSLRQRELSPGTWASLMSALQRDESLQFEK